MLTRESMRTFGVIGLAVLLAVLIAVPAGVAAANEEGAASEEGAGAPASEGGAGQMQADPQAASERSSFGGFRIYGDVLFNIQSVSVDGNDNRFRKDFGLYDGVYLGTSKLTFVPDGDEPAGWFDTIELYGDGIGFDSDKQNRYRQWGLTAKKADSYRFNLRSRAHNYFWVWDGYPGEFDLDRAFTDMDLSVNATDKLTVTARYRRWTNSGDQLSRFNYSGNQGDFPTVVDQSGNAFGVGLRYQFGSTTVFANQDFRNFKSDYDLRNTGDGSFASIAQSEVRDFSAPVTTGGFRTNLADRKVQVEGDILYSKQSLDSDYDRRFETGSGSSDLTTAVGSIDRKLMHANARVYWRPSSQWIFSARYARRSWDQTGDRTLIDDGRNNLNGLDYEVTLDRFLVGAEFAPARAFSVFGQFGSAKREQSFRTLGNIEDESSTDTTAYKFGARVRLLGRLLDLEGSYERNDIDNPFTRVSPADTEGYKAKLRLRPNWHWLISGTFNDWTAESDPVLTTDGSSELPTSKFRNYAVNVSYTGGAGRMIYAGYSYLDNEINTPVIIWNPIPRFEVDAAVLYEGKNSVWTFGGEYLLAESFPLTLYANMNYVDSDTTEVRSPDLIWTPVDFPVVYYDIRGGARYVLPFGLLLDVQGRWMQYEDTSSLFSSNTYDASMLVVGVGYRF
jgi:hypothetical protein